MNNSFFEVSCNFYFCIECRIREALNKHGSEFYYNLPYALDSERFYESSFSLKADVLF